MTQTFTDNTGRQWMLVVDTAAIKRLRKRLDVDLADVSGKTLERLSDDPVLLVDALWLLCEEDAAKAGVSDAAFGRALSGDPIDDAVTALLEAVIDFFPKSRRGPLRRIRTAMQRIANRRETLLADPRLDAAIDLAMEEMLQKTLTRLQSATGSPASSESPLSGSRSAN